MSFVDRSDFAVLGGDGHVESYGRLEKLGDVVHGLEKQQQINNNIEMQQEHSLGGEETENNEGSINFDTGNSPTTLMLFNIFTPDEVDFLSALVGDDAVKQLRDDANTDEEIKSDEIKNKYEPKYDPTERISTQRITMLQEQKQQYYNQKVIWNKSTS